MNRGRTIDGEWELSKLQGHRGSIFSEGKVVRGFHTVKRAGHQNEYLGHTHFYAIMNVAVSLLPCVCKLPACMCDREGAA